MDLKEQKYQESLKTQLFPLNLIEEVKTRRLSQSLFLFKICKNFPKDEIGKMKNLQKNQEKEKLCLELFNKKFEELDEHEYESLKRLSNERSQTPLKNSAYIKFLIKSFVMTFISNSKIASFKEESSNSWSISIEGNKFDISTNPEKFSTESLICFNSEDFLDKNKMIKKDIVLFLSNYFKTYHPDLNLVNQSFNKIIDNYNKLYNRVIDLKSIDSNERFDQN